MLMIFAKSFMTAAGYRLAGPHDAQLVEGNRSPKRKWFSWRGRL